MGVRSLTKEIESKTKFPNPPHQQTLCPSIRSACWLAKARCARAQWLRTRPGNTRLLFRTLLVSCRLGLPAPRLWKFRIEKQIPNLQPPDRPSLGRHSIVQWFRARDLVAKVFVSIPPGVMPLRAAARTAYSTETEPFLNQTVEI